MIRQRTSLPFWQMQLSVRRLLAKTIIPLIHKKILQIYALPVKLIGGVCTKYSGKAIHATRKGAPKLIRIARSNRGEKSAADLLR